jgi:hypothetical protein
MVQDLGPLNALLDQADRGDLADLYGALRLEVSYTTKRGWLMYPSGLPRVWLVCVSEEGHAP